MDRFDAIRTLLAAIDGGSLSAASRKLRMPLPTVSRKVSDLERHLGTQLVVRTSRKLLLTDAGRAFVGSARVVLDMLDDAERAASGEYRAPRGDLLVTAPILFGKLHVSPIAIEFLAAYQEVNLKLVLADHVVDLVGSHVDAALRIGPLPNSALLASHLGDIHWITCASPDYLARRESPMAPPDLAGHDCIAFEWLEPLREWRFGSGPSSQAIAITPRFSVSTAESVIDAAIAGMGICRVLSYQADSALRSGELVRVLPDHGPDALPVHLVHAGQAMIPLKLQAFLDFAKPRLKARIAAVGKA